MGLRRKEPGLVLERELAVKALSVRCVTTCLLRVFMVPAVPNNSPRSLDLLPPLLLEFLSRSVVVVVCVSISASSRRPDCVQHYGA